jgi:hypothetical protein
MGYTQYWRQTRDFTDTEWLDLCGEAFRIIDLAKELGVDVAGPHGEDEPEINISKIWLNGRAPDGNCETFGLNKNKRELGEWETPDPKGVFDFCKTRRRPYDKVVVSILHAVEKIAPGVIIPSSDGGLEAIRPAIDELSAELKNELQSEQ